MNNIKNVQPILIGTHTYGRYYKNTGVFECTHGAWEGQLEFVTDTHCSVDVVAGGRLMPFTLLECVPEEFDYT